MSKEKEVKPVADEVTNFSNLPGLSGKKVTITIPKTESAKTAVPGCLNGLAFNIPRGRPVDIPIEILAVLNEANVPVLEQDGTETGMVNRFNTQVLGPVI